MDQNSKNKQQKDIQAAQELISQAKKITLLTHEKPDSDGVSACAALAHILEKESKTLETIYPTKPEFDFKRQPKKILINKHEQTPDLIIMCDTANYERLYYPETFKDIPSINIDHHVSNTLKATVNFIWTETSSACEALYILLHKWGYSPIDTFTAECLLSGILDDTQSFYTTSTQAKTLRIAADLIDAGANLFTLQSELLHNKNPQILKLWGNLLSNITINDKQNSAWAVITQNDLKKLGITLTSLVGFSNFLAQLAQIDITALFYETEDGKSKVSLRSKKTDVNKLANTLGGGGHKNAAGITSDLPIDQIVQKVTGLF